MDLREVQTRLRALGYDPGPIDGIPGRMTAAAVAQFQRDNDIEVQWPGTIGPKTLAALFKGEPVAKPVTPLDPPWLALLLAKKGMHESQKATADFLRSDGRTLGDPRKLPWCGDLEETIMALTLPGEALPTNPYLARNWLKFGVSIAPTRGAVAVFYRGSPNGTSGHVGNFLGQDGDFYIVGGGKEGALSQAEPVRALWEQIRSRSSPVPVPLAHANQ